MRLFFALWPDESVRAALADRAAALHAVCGGRPTRSGNLHLTLAFLGNVDDRRVAEVGHAAGEVAPRAAILLLDRIGFWKRLAWAGASAVPGPIEELVLDLRDALTRSRIDFDPKAFVPHVTLLRDARQPQEIPTFAPILWNVDGFALVRSPAGRGAAYEVLDSWTLRKRC